MTTCNSLFVYGTLRRDSNNEMFHLLARFADFVDCATYQGKLYIIEDYPGVIPSEYSLDIVHGEVYKLRNQNMVLPLLDKYEECGSDFPEPTEYIRKIQPVRLRKGEIISAWIYIYNRSTDMLNEVPSGDFLKIGNG
jgi:gamma-glutamylcyclotransferase (GGCT)/AIG2-like uncharacterized protein YtfP